MRHAKIFMAVVVLWMAGSSLALEGVHMLKVKNLCEASMDIFIDGFYMGTVGHEAEFMMAEGSHMLFAKNSFQYTENTLEADQDYDWVLCE